VSRGVSGTAGREEVREKERDRDRERNRINIFIDI